MRMQTISITLTLFALFFTSLASQAYNMPKPSQDKPDHVISQNVDIHAFSDLMAQHADDVNAQIIDLRTPEEFMAGHIEASHLINFYAKDFVQNIQQLDKDKTYLLYCRSGNRSGKTLSLMKKLGFKSVYNMQGGMKAWTRAKYPVVIPK